MDNKQPNSRLWSREYQVEIWSFKGERQRERQREPLSHGLLWWFMVWVFEYDGGESEGIGILVFSVFYFSEAIFLLLGTEQIHWKAAYSQRDNNTNKEIGFADHHYEICTQCSFPNLTVKLEGNNGWTLKRSTSKKQTKNQLDPTGNPKPKPTRSTLNPKVLKPFRRFLNP